MADFSFVLNRDQADPNERMVSIGSMRWSVGGGGSMSMPNFFSMSEMFFDCDGKWDAPVCNGPGRQAYDYTLYAMKWRSRLRRFTPPSFGALLGQFVGNLLGSGGLDRLLGGSIRDVGLFGDLQSWAGSFGGEYGQVAASDAFGWLAGRADAQVSSVRDAAIGKVRGSGNGPSSLIIH
jgi:hypothetical protein